MLIDSGTGDNKLNNKLINLLIIILVSMYVCIRRSTSYNYTHIMIPRYINNYLLYYKFYN